MLVGDVIEDVVVDVDVDDVVSWYEVVRDVFTGDVVVEVILDVVVRDNPGCDGVEHLALQLVHPPGQLSPPSQLLPQLPPGNE